jgi:hypothetical protein
MVQALKEVLLRVEQLDEHEQLQIARLLQEEMTWNASFKKSQAQLRMLADEALAEFKSGKATQTDW